MRSRPKDWNDLTQSGLKSERVLMTPMPSYYAVTNYKKQKFPTPLRQSRVRALA